MLGSRSALLAKKWEFDFVWVSSFCCSTTAGQADAGIIGPEDMLKVVRRARRRIGLPIMEDMDPGYGDFVKVFHIVEAMAGAGAAAVSIEDNPISKRCSLYDGCKRVLVSIDEHVARLRSATAEAASPCRIIACTEALVAKMDIEEALKRGSAYCIRRC